MQVDPNAGKIDANANMYYVGPAPKYYCCTKSCVCTAQKVRQMWLEFFGSCTGGCFGSVIGLMLQGTLEGSQSKDKAPWEGMAIGFPSGVAISFMLIYMWKRCTKWHDAKNETRIDHLKVNMVDGIPEENL